MKTRFCPSPTGNIHLGNARTALFCALLAHKHQGELVLRIEDTDQKRSNETFTEQLLKDLEWLGITWEEGPQVGGPNGPYWQSQRQDIYQRYYEMLESMNLVYPCFCTEQQLAINRKIQASQGKPPRYPGTCSHLTKEAIQEKIAQGLTYTLRFHVPKNEIIQFIDLVKGEQRFNTDDIGDFIIRRVDQTAPFLFCNAIDDATMGITHILRGEDHLANTPRQIMILKALKLPIPHYGHISLIMGSDGGPLSKRHGSQSIKELKESGFLAIGVNNYLARLGHYYSDTHFMPMSELAAFFSTDNLGKSPARFDQDQLLYWQKEAVASSKSETLWTWFGKETHHLVPEAKRDLFITTVQPNVCFPQDALHWAQILFHDSIDFSDEQKTIIQTAGGEFFKSAKTAIETFGIDYDKLCSELKIKLGIKGKALFQPLRIALTGSINGPELKNIMELLGSEKVQERLETAAKLC